MKFYDGMQKIATGLLKEFNQGVMSYIQVTPGTGTLDNPGSPRETPYLLEGATSRGVQFRYLKDGLALASDSQITMAVDSRFIPDISGFIEKDGSRFKIVQVIAKPDAGTPAVYVLIIRRV